MFRTSLKTPPLVLALLLLFNFLILSVQIRSEQGQSLLTRTGLTVITPFVFIEQLVLNTASDLVHRYVFLLAQDREFGTDISLRAVR